MTVKELIELLAKEKQDMEVVVFASSTIDEDGEVGIDYLDSSEENVALVTKE